MDTKSTTLFGGIQVPVVFEDGHTEKLTVRQLKIREWKHALKLMDDEMLLVAFCCAKDPAEMDLIRAESYERLHQAMQKANAEGFFTFAARQVERAAENLRNLPPEIVEKMLGVRSTSSTPSPAMRPPGR